MINDDDVKKIAKLAYLIVGDEERKKLGKELNSILEYVKHLETADVSNVSAMSHVHGSTNVVREDVVKPSLTNEEALKNAPDRSGRYIRVPIIIDQSSEN
jgi:aspartyl-tRNA(Asn)/glutamyl-tRNA(Gln) amidotransferase subunit C